MIFGKLNTSLCDNMANKHNKKEYAKSIFIGIMESSSINDIRVSIALPIANYAVDYLTLAPKAFIKTLDLYVDEHVEVINGKANIIIEDELKTKYPIDGTQGSKLTALACEFVENNK